MAEKEVLFYKWCFKCKHYLTNEVEDPCDECLTESVREDSHKPVNFEPTETEEETK